MSGQPDFSNHSLEELQSKKNLFKKRQLIILIMGVLTALILTVVAFTQDNAQLYPVIILLLVMAIGYPLMAFGPIQKRIQSEIDSRN